MPEAKSNLGQRLKQLRAQKRLSLNDLASKSKLSRSTLYKVENSGMSLTYEKLIDLSDGLGVEISELFRASEALGAEAMVGGRREAGRRGQGYRITTDNYDSLYLCNEIIHKGLVPMIGRVKAHSLAEFGPMSGHPGEEFTYVLEGSIEVHTQLYRPVILNEDDYIYLDSTMPHAFISRSEEDACVLTVCTRPEHKLDEALPVQVEEPVSAVAGRRGTRK